MSNEYTPLIEAFLLIEQPRTRLGHWTQALAALDSSLAPPLAQVIAYYDPSCDQALLDLRYDELALGPSRLEYVVEIALLAEVGMIQPHELSEAERKRFLMERLTRCTHQVTYQRSVIGALTELVRKVKENKSAGGVKTIAAPLPRQPPPIPAAARRPPRGDTADPVLLVPARGTRDDLKTAAEGSGGLAKSTRDLPRMDDTPLPLPPPPPRGEPPRGTPFDDGLHTAGKHVVSRSSRLPTVEMSPSEAERLITNTEVVDVEMQPPMPPRPPRAPSPSTMGSDRYLPSPTVAAAPKVIYARYLRSGKWVAMRVGALSLKGAALMAGALPRLHDHVDIALSFGGHRALVRGSVNKVSSMREAQATGASTFSVKFQLDDAARKQLIALLTAARAANVTIKPPPPRSTRRYPVEWPVCLGTVRGAIKGDALDVSTDGMFVRPMNALTLDAVVTFSVVLDDNGPPVAGRGRVVRHVAEVEAKTAGLSPGYGLQIMEMTDADRMRWRSFLSRVERRADKRVLVGASPARLAELQAALAAVGYAVIGGTDPGAVMQLASAEARPVDGALIDGGWLHTGASSSWVENLFSSRNVPFVTLHGDARRARTAIDKLLEVLV